MRPLHLPAVSTELQYGLYELDAAPPAAEAPNPERDHAAAAGDEETDENDACFA